ncbi:MAG: sulfatase [Pirellulaceae bacterium]
MKHVPGVDTLDPKLKTWVHCLKANGYKTAMIGKWHLSDDPSPYGFDINIGGSHSGSPPRGYYPPHNAPGLKDAPADEYLTDRLTDEAMKFIREQQTQPWCLYLSHFAVHTPLQAKRELLAKYQSKPIGDLHQHVVMATMIQAVDDGVGRIESLLNELKLKENTIVVFYSDNGGLAAATDMRPLRGSKGMFYEGGIRVPLFVRWPGKIQPIADCSVPVIGVDLYPTLCELTGSRVLDASQPLDGQSLLPLLLPQQNQRFDEDRALFWHFPAYLQASRQEGLESRDPLFRTRPCGIIRQGKWKLHEYFEDGGLELYDLDTDPGETTNLSTQQLETTRRLQQKLIAWRQAIGAPVPLTKNDQFDPVAEAKALQR